MESASRRVDTKVSFGVLFLGTRENGPGGKGRYSRPNSRARAMASVRRST
jgi:hypothetical protein